jgi:hypothetical protein
VDKSIFSTLGFSSTMKMKAVFISVTFIPTTTQGVTSVQPLLWETQIAELTFIYKFQLECIRYGKWQDTYIARGKSYLWVEWMASKRLFLFAR